MSMRTGRHEAGRSASGATGRVVVLPRGASSPVGRTEARATRRHAARAHDVQTLYVQDVCDPYADTQIAWAMGKRGAGAASSASGGGRSAKKPKTAASGRPLFFIAPGAGGELAADKPGEAPRSIKTLLAEIGDVAGPMDKPPMGGGGCSAKALAAFQTAVEGVCADHPGRDVWLATQSFGGRLAVHTTIGGIENRDATGKPKPWPEARSLPGAVKGIIAFGYPLYHAKQNRGAPLLELPKGTSMMFVMGEKDETALGKPVNKALLTSKHYTAPFARSHSLFAHTTATT